MPESDFRLYKADEVISFRKTGEEFGGLSNMAPGFPIRVGDVRLRTSEALYQACRFPHMPEVQKIIVSESSPMTAKMRSKPYRANSREYWDDLRVPIMKWCLRVKLVQNWNAFGHLLLRTNSLPIVEDSKKDDFWGAIKNDRGEFRGRNVLGRLLMELREKLRTDPTSLEEIQPVRIQDFKLFEKNIPIITIESSRSCEKEIFYSSEGLLIKEDTVL